MTAINLILAMHATMAPSANRIMMTRAVARTVMLGPHHRIRFKLIRTEGGEAEISAATRATLVLTLKVGKVRKAIVSGVISVLLPITCDSSL